MGSDHKVAMLRRLAENLSDVREHELLMARMVSDMVDLKNRLSAVISEIDDDDELSEQVMGTVSAIVGVEEALSVLRYRTPDVQVVHHAICRHANA